MQSKYITSFILEPVDGHPVARFSPGQYISVFIKPEGATYRQIRQYSLTNSSFCQTEYRIAIKREDKGVVSRWMHSQAQEGSIIELTSPKGAFILKVHPQTPVTLISAGTGVTPMLAMLDSLAYHQHAAQVNWFHAAVNSHHIAFDEEVKALGKRLACFTCRLWFSQPENDSQKPLIVRGNMHLSTFKDDMSTCDMQFYLCGPHAFMVNIYNQLSRMSITTERIHYECHSLFKIRN